MNQSSSEVFVYLNKRKGDDSYRSNDLMNISDHLEPKIQNNFIQPSSDGTIQILNHNFKNSIDVQLQQSIYPIENNIKNDCIIENDEQDCQRVNTIILSVPISKTSAFEQVEVDLAEQDKNQIVNIDECFLKLKKMHIQYKTEEDEALQYNFCKANCSTQVGCSGCFYSSQEKSSLNNLGIAINIYFKQMKGLVWLTLLFMIMSIPTIVFYSMAASKGEMSTINNFSSFLAYTFAGAWGYDVWECKMGTFENLNQFDSGKLQCETGVFDTSFMRFGIIDQSNSENFLGCEFAQVENIDENCFSNPIIYFTELCNNKSECQINFTEMIQKSFKQDAYCKQYFLQNQIYLSFPCANSRMDFGSFSLKKANLSIYCVIVDNIIFFAFLIAVFSLTYSDQVTLNQITMNNCMTEHFSILIRNLPNIEQKFLASKLWEHLQKYLDQYCQNNQKQPIKIIDIKLGYRYRQIKYQVLMGKVQRKLERLILFFLQEYGKQNEKLKDLTNITINHLRAIYELISDIEMKEKANLNLQKIINLKQELFTLRTKDIEFNQKKNNIDYAWVTFETMDQKQKAWNILQTSKIKYFYYTIIYKLHEKFKKDKKNEINYQINQLHFMGKVLVLEKSYSPDSIIWQNLYFSKINIFFRRLFLIIASIAIVILSFIGVAILRSLDRLLTDNYPQANCYSPIFSNLTLKIIQNLPDTMPDYQKKAYIQCLCWRSNYQFNQSKELKPICEQWFFNYIEKLTIPIGIVLVVFFVNWLFKKIYTYFTNLEKYVYQDKRKNSIILKLFTISFINSVLVVFFINRAQQNTQKDSSQFMVQVFANGQYYDFNSEWYRNVGVIYALTIISKCFFIPLQKLFYYFYKKFEIWRDQGYTTNLRATKCKSNEQFIKLRRGPKFNLEIRYAQNLEVLYLMIVFGSGIPLMYFTAFLYFLLTLMADRYLIFSVCRIPKPSNDQMSQLFQKILYFSFFLHWVVSSFTFGSPLLFYDIQDKKSLDKSTSKSEPFIYNIVDNRYLIPQYFGIVIIVLTYILSFYINPFKIITAFTRKKTPASEKKSSIKNNSFYEFLTKEQIITEMDIAGYTVYANSTDSYVVHKMIERYTQLELQLQQRENQEPKMTFLGAYSFDYKVSKKFKEKLRWQQDLKIWRLEQSKAMHKQLNSLSNQRYFSMDYKISSSKLSNQFLVFKQKQIQFESSKLAEKQLKQIQEIQDYNKNLKSQRSVLKQNVKDQKKQSPSTKYIDKNNSKDLIFFLNNGSASKIVGQNDQIFININSNYNINLNSNHNVKVHSNQNINLNRDSNELYFFKPKYQKSQCNHDEKQKQSVVQSEQEIDSKSKHSQFDLAFLGKKQQSIYNTKPDQLNGTPNQDNQQEDNSNLEINDDLEHKKYENNMQINQLENDATSVDGITLHQKPYSFQAKI
ncbi:hypothetical protein ABPG72_017878 [Tetrahymena utriculariae]